MHAVRLGADPTVAAKAAAVLALDVLVAVSWRTLGTDIVLASAVLGALIFIGAKVTKGVRWVALTVSEEVAERKAVSKVIHEELPGLRHDFSGLAREVGRLQRDGSVPVKALIGRVSRLEDGQAAVLLRIEGLEALPHRTTDAPPALHPGDQVVVIPRSQTREGPS